MPAAPVNAVLSGLLAVEAAALKVADMPAGSSLLCLAQKADNARLQACHNDGRSVDLESVDAQRQFSLVAAAGHERPVALDAHDLVDRR